MIAADSSSLIAFFAGEDAADTRAIQQAAVDERLMIPPMVQFELLSGDVPETYLPLVCEGPLLPVRESCWADAGRLRRHRLSRRLKARAMDCLIAQSCIDADVALITRDADFRHFKPLGLKLLT